MVNPIPALPDAERRTEYPIAAATGPFDVGFALYGNSTDYASWLEVWLNGVKLTATTDWTLSSPSGLIANLLRPITDAKVTLAQASTGTLEIVGARRPRRTSQLTENRGVPARDFLGILPGASARANFSLGFNASGVLTLQALPSGYPASSYFATVLAAPDAASARALLGVTVSPDAGSTVAFVNWQNFR